MTRYLETDTQAGINIAGAVAIASYTSDTDRLVLAQALMNGVAGNGDYTVYATLQLSGGGLFEYILLPKMNGTAAIGETAIGAQSIMIPMRDNDILTVYVDGLPADIAVNTTVRFFDVATCCPLGTGPYTFTYNVTNSVTGLPIDSVHVLVSTDIAGTNIICDGYTDVFGNVVFYFDVGTYYFWSYKVGFTFVLPDTEIVP